MLALLSKLCLLTIKELSAAEEEKEEEEEGSLPRVFY
jgi:hypothetical protein